MLHNNAHQYLFLFSHDTILKSNLDEEKVLPGNAVWNALGKWRWSGFPRIFMTCRNTSTFMRKCFPRSPWLALRLTSLQLQYVSWNKCSVYLCNHLLYLKTIWSELFKWELNDNYFVGMPSIYCLETKNIRKRNLNITAMRHLFWKKASYEIPALIEIVAPYFI